MKKNNIEDMEGEKELLCINCEEYTKLKECKKIF